MAETFDPYYKWLGIPPKDQPPHHYRLLGIELFEEDRDVIDAAANRVMSYLKDLATGDEAAHSQELLNEISGARIGLLNKEKKSAYDEQLREKLKADGLLQEGPRKPPAKKPPPKSPKSSGPPPAKPPAAAPPPPGATAPPIAPKIAFPVLEASAERPAVSKPASIVIRTEDEQKDRAADPNETEDATDQGQVAGKRSHSRLAVLAGLLVLSVVSFLIVMIFFGGNEEPEPKPRPQAPDARTTEVPPVLILGLRRQEANALTAFLLDGVPQSLPPEKELVLSAGTHRIVLRREGFEEISETVTLVDGESRRFAPQWKPIDVQSPGSDTLTPGSDTLMPGSDTLMPGSGLSGFPSSFDSSVVTGFTSGFGRMVGHWALDDDAEDDSGNDNHGTFVDGPTFVEGRLGRALRLDGNQRFEVHDRLFADSSEFSTAFWVRLDSIPTATGAFLNGGGLAVYLQAGRPRLRVQQSEPLAGQNTDAQTNGFSGIDLAEHLNDWVHLAIVYSAPARQVHYYVNGERQGYQQYSKRMPAEMTQVVVSNIVGALDDLRIFDYRLGNTDVKAICEGSYQPLLSAPDEPNGRLVCETWYDVPPALDRNQIERITVQSADDTFTVKTWGLRHLPRGSSNYLLNRIRGFVYPSEDGEYVFTLHSSGSAMLYLQRFGSDEDSLTRLILSEPTSQAVSPSMSLEANKAYYFELVEQCDNTRNRGIRVGWRRVENPLSKPIPLTCLASYGEAN